ncbi:MAG: GMC family oxidoreductase [Rhodopila sp.]
MGTCRQSANARDGVCNSFGQSHDIPNLFISDGSQFTTSGAENPTLTIVALAIRQSGYVADYLNKRT